MSTNFRYQSGFGNFFESEALEGSLPKGKNSPQKVNFGLYAEQLSGSAFTMPRKSNLRSWLYRIRPSVVHGSYKKFEKNVLASAPLHRVVTPEQYRWSPRPMPEKTTDFVEGLMSVAAHGDVVGQTGAAIHLYHCNAPMAQINDNYYEDLDEENFRKILKNLKQNLEIKKGSQLGRQSSHPSRKT